MNELSVVPFLIFRAFAVLLLLDVWVAPHDVMSTLFLVKIGHWFRSLNLNAHHRV